MQESLLVVGFDVRLGIGFDIRLGIWFDFRLDFGLGVGLDFWLGGVGLVVRLGVGFDFRLIGGGLVVRLGVGFDFRLGGVGLVVRPWRRGLASGLASSALLVSGTSSSSALSSGLASAFLSGLASLLGIGLTAAALAVAGLACLGLLGGGLFGATSRQNNGQAHCEKSCKHSHTFNSLLGTCRRSLGFTHRAEPSCGSLADSLVHKLNLTKSFVPLFSRSGSLCRRDFVSLMFGMTTCKGREANFDNCRCKCDGECPKP